MNLNKNPPSPTKGLPLWQIHTLHYMPAACLLTHLEHTHQYYMCIYDSVDLPVQDRERVGGSGLLCVC